MVTSGAGGTLPDLVEAQVGRRPEDAAVVAGDGTLTFADLDARANQLAHHLGALGVGPDVLVGVCVDRSLDMAVGLLGILKAGGACLPLDPSYPPARLTAMLDDAAPPVVLTQAHLHGRLPAHGGGTVHLDGDRPALERHPPTAPARAIRPHHLAYVIYTSGSTGRPRGVLLPHGALVNHALAALDLYRLVPGDRVLQFCSISFDVSIEELFPTWAAGATAVLRPDDVPLLGREWADWLEDRGITMLNLPTAYWHDWVRDLAALGRRVPPAVRVVVVGGEKALGSAYRTWREVSRPEVRWINAYGPTEASVMATTYEPAAGGDGGGGDPPIGRPLPNVTVHVLDDRRRPVAPGAAGELYLGGAGLARGYLGLPELTAERFVPDPWSGAGGRMYRTGDVVRERPDGQLEFVGRVDHQVKIRGFRIECGEVETALGAHPAVDRAVVVARELRPGDRQLVAYVVPRPGAGAPPPDLRHFVAARLPAYMVPASFVALDTLPLTPNGKVDRDALPAPARPSGGAHGPRPRTGAEEMVAAVWGEVLGVDGLGADDDFFELGGHSLLATQVVARLREISWPDAPLHAIFEAPTVAGLAAALEARRSGDDGRPPLVPQPRSPGERLPLSVPQEQMWGLEIAADPPGLYNVTAQHRFEFEADVDVLGRTLAHLVERHETLRTSFPTEAGRPWQSVSPSAAVTVEVADLATLPAEDREAELRRLVGDQDARPFDLSTPPLVRCGLYRLGDGTSDVAVTFDHLVCDGTSAFVFLGELAAAYDAFAAGRDPVLRPLPLQYADFAVWQRRWITEERLDDQLAYWKRKLDGMPLGPALPFDRVPATPTRRIRSRPLAVPRPVHEAVQRLARSTHSTAFVVVTAAVQAVLARLGDRTDIVVSTTLSGRQRSETEGVIGFFAGIGRIRTDLSGDPPFTTVLDRVRDSVLGLFDNQDVPFMRVRRELFPHFPGPDGGVGLLAALPVDLQYFRAAADEWSPGTAVVQQPAHRKGADRLWFRGQLHPLAVTLLDDGREMWGEVSWKVDFYDDATIEAVASGFERLLPAAVADPGLRLSGLPA